MKKEKQRYKEIMEGLNRIEKGLEKIRLQTILDKVVRFYANNEKEAKDVCYKIEKNGDITFY